MDFLVIGRTGFLVGKAIEREFEKRGIDLNIRQFALLYVLQVEGHLIQQDLATFMQKDKSAILRSVNTLVEKELVERTFSEDDRRKKILQFSEAGKTLFDKAKKISNEVITNLLDGLAEAEITAYIKVALHLQNKVACKADSNL